ncbi:MAG: methyltransferase domain-containing protein [Candidatus Thorarchaeota archaeon]|nr:MAG: methyltransferase domain-containing protein [Candidatus Thorarchaeota archaeon]
MRFIDYHAAETILAALEDNLDEVEVSLDLGLSMSRISTHQKDWTVEDLEKIAADKDSIYFTRENQILKAALSGRRFYKLMPTGLHSPPALLIDGVLMHRMKSIDPMSDARSKANLCAQQGSKMLEICTGLGYSTIACLDKNVSDIVTIERDENVLELASINPWSKRLFEDDRVKIVNADAVEEIVSFEEVSFDAVLHDPPRFSMSSDLYTAEFYASIFRVLKPGGVLFHYVGTPGSKYRGKDLQKGVMKRLRSVGFEKVERKPKALGVLARKPPV